MNVTIVTTYFEPEISPVTHLYAALAEDFVTYGAQVTVVTNLPQRGLDEAARAAYRARTDERTAAGYRVLRTGGGREGTHFLVRGFRLLIGAWKLFLTARRVETDVYLLGSMPPFLGLIGAWLHKRAHTVYILQDIFPDTLLLMGKLSMAHPVLRLCRWMEKRSYLGNTRLITLSQDMAETLLARGVDADRLDVIPNWADCETVQPVARADNALFDALGLSRDAFIALYAGTLGLLQRPDVLLDAAKLLLERQREIQFVIFGGGGQFERVRERVANEGLHNVRLYPLLRAARAGEVYSVGDVAVVPLASGVTRVAMPSKTATAMAAGRPLVVTAEPGSAWERQMAEAGCAFCVPPDDPAALAQALEQAYEARGALDAMGERARAYATTHFDRATATRRYYEVLLRSTAKGSTPAAMIK